MGQTDKVILKRHLRSVKLYVLKRQTLASSIGPACARGATDEDWVCCTTITQHSSLPRLSHYTRVLVALLLDLHTDQRYV